MYQSMRLLLYTVLNAIFLHFKASRLWSIIGGLDRFQPNPNGRSCMSYNSVITRPDKEIQEIAAAFEAFDYLRRPDVPASDLFKWENRKHTLQATRANQLHSLYSLLSEARSIY
ncbi:hypothetical protein F5B17DRAFT_219914 [Nemania serpens]|nr:hypothetical protein F5B17DRAFT_219914 [Nemania serpens]